MTVRHRDTMQQERVAIDALFGLVDAECSLRSLLKKLNVLTGLSRVFAPGASDGEYSVFRIGNVREGVWAGVVRAIG